MAGVDSLLRMMATHGADELRIGTDLPPKMLKRGAPVRLSIPPTDDTMVQHLLEGILTPEREQVLRSERKLELTYDGHSVTLQARDAKAVDAIFRKGAPVRPASATPTAAQITTATPPISPIAPPIPPIAPPIAAPPLVTAVPPIAPPLATPPTPLATAVPPMSSVPADLFERAVSMHASDIHLLQGEAATLRIDGKLRPLDEPSDVLLDAWSAELPPSGPQTSLDRAFEVPGVGRFRLNLYRTGGRLAAAIRVLPRRAPSLAELHFPVPLEDVVHAPHGLVLVCGPTGSGKSATLAALAGEALRHRGGVLVTLEDPVEYRLEAPPGALVRQREIGRDVRDFSSGLRDALREDPDVLLIGEMRDAESIGLALTAAETGHLVLASLHSRSATASVERIVDSYPPERQQQIRLQLADSLRAVIAQRLLPRARGAGRIPAVEILRGNHTVASLIREGKSAQLPNTVQSSRKEGMLPLERCLADLVRSAQITRESALAAANDVATLQTLL
jgi:twitching motility protein PilT